LNLDSQTLARPGGGARARALLSLGSFLMVIVLTYLGLLAVTFFIGRVIPVDPALAIVGDRAPEHVLQRVREELGLNLPLPQQFVRLPVEGAAG
jgi:peptide/nickel transport system permease protein